MCNCSDISWWLAAWRALHFLACLLPVGLLAYHVLVAEPVLRTGVGPSRPTMISILCAMIVVIVSGAAWLLLVAGNIGDVTPIQALRQGVVTAVLNQTRFGNAWRLRAAVWLAATVICFAMLLRNRATRNITRLCLLACSILLGSLAWAGHGLDGDGNAGRFHVLADVVHLLVGAVWPFGLLPFAIALIGFHRESDPVRWSQAAALTRRFSTAALICVALLTFTGTINCYFMLPSVSSLWTSGYGKLLSAKIIIFLATICLAAINRLRLRPQLSTGIEPAATALRLRRNVMAEFALGTAVILIVALLGLLSPPMPGM